MELGIKEAAAYCGLSVPGLKYHIKEGHVTGRLMGRRFMVFSVRELDRFKATPRKVGRPRKEPKK